MRYFALYQREFTGQPQLMKPDSHVLTDTTTADDLETVFAQFQAEVMTETRRARVAFAVARHTSMSVGDFVLDETGHCFAVMPVGFEKAVIVTLESRTELALQLLSLGLERTPGWAELFEQDPALLGAAIVDRIRNDAYGTGSRARKPYGIRPTLVVDP